MKKYLSAGLIFFFVFAPLKLAYGQNLDSLYVEFFNAEGSDFIKLANTISKKTGDTATFSNKTPREEILSLVVKKIIFHYYDQQRFNDVIRYADRAVEIYETLKDSFNLAGCYHTLGIAYHRAGMFNKSIDSYYKSSDILEAIGADNSKRRKRAVLNNIGAIYAQYENFEMAEKLYKQCITLINNLESEEQNNLDLAIYLANLSEIYNKQSEKLEGNAKKVKIYEAINSAEKALELSRKYNDSPDKLAKRLITLAVAYISNKEFSKAEKILDEAEKIANIHNFEYLKAETFGNNALLQNSIGNQQQANNFYDKAIKIAEENDYNELLKHITHAAYLSNKEINPANALKYFEKFVSIKDSIFNEESRRQISDFQVKYNIQEKEFEILRHKAEVSQHKNLQFIYKVGLIFAGVILLLLVYIAVLHAKRNRELKELNATKDKFFSIISHDLKNPAVAQRNALQQLVYKGKSYDAGTLSEYYSRLLKSADYEVELLNNLLNWAKVQLGRMPFTPTTFDPIELFSSEIARFLDIANAKNINFKVQLPEKVFLTGDRNMMIVVLRNLLTNAMNFTPNSGTVTLNISSSGKDRKWSTSSETEYIISISDTGNGIPKEQLQNLFCIDKQQPKSDTVGDQSSGLGLIVCKELVEKHGSKLYVESNEGEGSRFWFEISGVKS